MELSWHTTKEAGVILGLKQKTVMHYIQRNLITAEKKGRDYFISNQEIRLFQEKRKMRGRPTRENARTRKTV